VELLAVWDWIQLSEPKHWRKNDESRSKTPAYHFGVWETTASQPIITRESHLQRKEAIRAIDGLLGLVKKYVVPRIVKGLQQDLPIQWQEQEQ
jgi:hypothetical protein